MLPTDARRSLRVLVTGGGGMLGRSLQAAVAEDQGGSRIEATFATRPDADLRDRTAVRALLCAAAPDVVVHCAARVGGIAVNAADQTGFLLDNATIDTTLFGVALELGVPGLLYLGSSCTYPRDHRQPLVEEDLLQGGLEPTNEGYALAKLTGTRLCHFISEERGLAYRAVVASNLYGPGDDCSSATGHLVASALAKVHTAHRTGSPRVTIWGDGTARREFTYAGDLARWIVGVLPRLEQLPAALNVGAGTDHSVDDYYEAARTVVGYRGEFLHDTSFPVGMRRKLMDSTRARAFGWRPTTSIEDGMRATYEDLLATAALA